VTRRERYALAALLLLQTAAIAYEVTSIGIIVDEPSHMVSAHMYWRGEDRLKPGDMPPFIKILGGWPSLFVTPRLPVDSPAWQSGHEWNIGGAMLDRMKPAEIDRYVLWSRAPFVVIAPLTTLLLWFWARRLWGPVVAWTLAALWALEPTALGHAAFFKNDLSATLAYLAFWYAAWRFWCAPSWRRAAWVALSLALTVSTKMSMLVLLPVGPLLLFAGAIQRRRWRDAILWPVASLLIVYCLTAAACQFDLRPLLPHEAQYLRLPPFTAGLPLPARYIDGVYSLLSEDRGVNTVYLFGVNYPGGHRLYFLAALLLKTPLPVLGLLAAALVLAARRFRLAALPAATCFLLVPPLYYIGFASFSTLQLGVRLIMPAVPFLILLCGGIVHWLWERRQTRWVLSAALAWTAVSVLQHYPYTLSYFNELSPDIASRRWALSDSNLDWGQGLPALRRWCLRNQVKLIHLSCFSNDPPFRHFPDSENMVDLVAPPWNDEVARGLVLKPEPGIWVISVSLLSGQFWDPKYKDYYRAFQQLEPDEVVAGSLLVYRIH
jgi:hypothetical protein